MAIYVHSLKAKPFQVAMHAFFTLEVKSLALPSKGLYSEHFTLLTGLRARLEQRLLVAVHLRRDSAKLACYLYCMMSTTVSGFKSRFPCARSQYHDRKRQPTLDSY